MQPQTYTQLLEILTCMGVYNARVYNFKNNPDEVSACAKSLKEMAEDVQQLGHRTFNPALWKQYCAGLHGDKPVEIAASELQSEAWLQILQKMSRIVSITTVLKEDCHNPEMVTHITAHELKPLLNECKELLDNEHGEIRGKSFLERVKERFGRK